MTAHDIVEILTVTVTVLNAIVLGYMALKKLRPQVKKLDIEAESEIVDAANQNLEGAKISAKMLMERIEELKKDLDNEKAARKEEQAMNEKFRRDDAEYFRRRIRDMEKETRDLRSWIARLVKQVVELGHVPAPFIPSSPDSEPNIPPIRNDDDTRK